MPVELDLLKSQLIAYNLAYRLGEPMLSDEEFDIMLDTYKVKAGLSAYNKLREQLLESKGDVKHEFTVGSLEKFTIDENEELQKWINPTSRYCITPKIDGLSICAIYSKGKLVKAVTRGDGITGVDQTNKLCRILPIVIDDNSESLIIRGECVILKSNFDIIKHLANTDFKNRRNAAIGIVNAKNVDLKLLNYLTFIPFAKWQPDNTYEQPIFIEYLKKLGFYEMQYLTCSSNTINCGYLEDTYNLWNSDPNKAVDFDMDGLVIQEINHTFEANVYLPTRTRAFKVNKLVAETTIEQIDWQISKSGYLCPVGILKPVELGGATVSRCTLFSAKVVKDNNLCNGTVISMHKAGDIIPKFDAVIAPSQISKMELPSVCPYCGATLVEVLNKNNEFQDLQCCNPSCKEQGAKKMAYILRNLGVDRITDVSLLKWGITDITSLLAYTANLDYKSSIYFYEALAAKLFNQPKEVIWGALDWDGIGMATWKSIFTTISFDALTAMEADLKNFIVDDVSSYTESIKNIIENTEGVNKETIKIISNSYSSNKIILDQIVNDPRYNPIISVEATKSFTSKVNSDCLSICVTGALSMSRSKIKTLVEQKGFIFNDSLIKTTNYLVTNDTSSNSSKLVKARKLNIKIINEEELIKLLNQ